MTQFEYEIERDKIQMDYDRKIAKHKNTLYNLRAQEADLHMQIHSITKEYVCAQAMIDELERGRKAELLELNEEFAKTKEPADK